MFGAFAESLLRLLLFSTVFDVVCDWKPLATAEMKSSRKPERFNGLWT
jgi:hypothetical protein